MDKTIVAIIVGLLSGALGSVLGPVVTHQLRGRERKEERECEIHRELRQMIEERLEECGRMASLAFRIHVYVAHSKLSPFDAYNRATAERWEEERRRSYHRWEPYRITDDRLRSLVERLHDGLDDFRTHHMAIMTIDFDEWCAKTNEKEKDLKETERQVRLRLDELRW